MKKLRKLGSKTLAILLSFLIIISVIPMQSLATTIQNTLDTIELEDKTEPLISEEIISKRDEYSKTYKLENNTYYEVISPTPIHENINGQWVEPNIERGSPVEVEEVVDYCNELSENISSNGNVISPLSYEPQNPFTPAVEHRIVGTVDKTYYQFDRTTYLLLKVPHNFIGEDSEHIVTINCKLHIETTVSAAGKLYVYAIKNSWDINQTGLKKSDIIINTGMEDYCSISNSSTYSFDITNQYLRWEKGLDINNGIAIKPLGSPIASINGCYMTRQYKLIDTYDTDFTYHAFDMGRAGTVFVNDFTNTITLSREEIGFDSNVLPVQISRLFDFSKSYSTNNPAGKGSRWNYSSSISTFGESTCIWKTFDGSTIYFNATNFERNVWTDIKGEGYTLTSGETAINSRDYSSCTITSPENIVYSFNCAGKLIKITDAYSNEISISYLPENAEEGDAEGTYITFIEDSIGRKYKFNYSVISYPIDDTEYIDINTLTSISAFYKSSDVESPILIDNVAAKIQYEYILLPNHHLALSKVIYPDDKYVEYKYNEYGYLSEVIDIDGRRLLIEYATVHDILSDGTQITTGSPCATSLTEKVINIDDHVTVEDENYYLLKSYLNIDRHNTYQRVFTDHLGKKETIHYNENLKMLYYQNSDGDTFYADYSTNNRNEYLSQIVSPENATSIIENYDFEYGYMDPWYELEGNVLDVVEGSFLKENNYYINISGSPNVTKAVAQDIPINGIAGDIYVVGGWANINAPIPNKEHFAGIEVYPLSKKINGTLYLPDETAPLYQLAFDATIDGENQFRLGAFKLEENVEGLQFRWVYSVQAGNANFDEAMLYKSNDENVSFFEFEEFNNTVTSNDVTEIVTTYNDKGLVMTEKTTHSSQSMLMQNSYDDNYFLSTSTDNNNITTNYTYDSKTGFLTQKSVGNNEIKYSYTPVGALKEVSTAVSGLTNNINNIKTTYTYSGDRIESIVHNNTTFKLNYNSFGNVKSVQINPNENNDSNLITYNYSIDYKQNLNSIEYANGDKLFYTYDDSTGNVLSILSNDKSVENSTATKLLYEYTYNAAGELIKITDYDSNRTVEYTSTGHTIKEFTLSDTQDIIEGRTISTFSIDASGNKTINLFGKNFVTQTNESQYDEEKKETIYATQCNFGITNGDIIYESRSISDYFGRIKYSQISVAMANNPTATHNIRNSYTYKEYTTSNDDSIVNGTTNLIQSYTSEVFTAQSNNSTDTVVSLTTSYRYDDAGRITHVFYNQGSSDVFALYYRYDTAGQLVLEFDDLKGVLTEYSYDSYGNITAKKIYQKDQIIVDYDKETYTVKSNEEPQIITYTYGNPCENGLTYSDVLTSVSNSTISNNAINISYDKSGNPLNLFMSIDDDFTPYTLEWDGTLLKSITNTENRIKCDYAYDNTGLRTKKTIYSIVENNVNGELPSYELLREINYVWDDEQLIGSEIVTHNDGTSNSIVTKTLYDEYGSPIGVYYKSNLPENSNNILETTVLSNEGIFWFIKDGQGNVKAMFSDSNDYTLGCTYDAYGNITLNLNADFLNEINNQIFASTSTLEQVLLATVASIVAAVSIEATLSIGASTYKGYIFDTESGLLYCQNRYYSPTLGRFINMDDPAQLTLNTEEPLNSNLYIYCCNDPINNIDPTGRSKYTLSAVGMQAEMSASLLSLAGSVGIELVYVWSRNAMYAYYYYSGGVGLGYTNRAINYLSNSLNYISMNPKISLKNMANLFKLNWSITIGFFAALTDKKFSWPNSYTGAFDATAISIGKYKGYKAIGNGCKAYGICYAVAGNSGFSVSQTQAKYKRISFNSSAVRNYLYAQKNTIKNATT